MKIFLHLSLLLIMVIFPASAQDELTQTIELPEGYVISVPEDWEFEADSDTGGIYLNSADYTVYILTPPQVAEAIILDKSSNTADVLVAISAELFDREVDADSVEDNQMGDRDASRTYYTLEEDVGVSYVIELAEASFAFVDGVASAGKVDELEDILMPSLETLRPADEAVASAEPCLVSTDSRDTARLRVGPGENRSAVAFLPAEDDFEVQGRFIDGDGNVWYQLDKESAAPQSAASEIWVAQADVTETGGCDAVVDASAPPIVPITGGNTGNTNQGGAVPAGSLWTLTLNSEADASCEGTGNIHLQTIQVFNPRTLQATISVSGSILYFEGLPFSRTRGSTYFGSIEIARGNAQLTLTIVNTNRITGQMVADAVFDGHACSVTVGLTITR